MTDRILPRTGGAWHQIAPLIFDGRVDSTHLPRIFGGTLASQAVRAATIVAGPGVRIYGLYVHFVGGGKPAQSVRYTVEPIAQGRNLQSFRVVGRQGATVAMHATVNFRAVRDGYTRQIEAPTVTSPEECRPLIDDLARRGSSFGEFWEKEWGRYFEIRLASSPVETLSRQLLWIRALPASPFVNGAEALTFISDLTPIGVALQSLGEVLGSKTVAVSTLDHAMWFHRSVDLTDWVLYDQACPTTSGGFGLIESQIFSRAGGLVAHVTQHALIRRHLPHP
ncbi:hypothetical protein EEB14_13380 [Rhodococcus sp. WS4]|nr:hypothetical protein EEB14_13380 [Rhodococcus sp. WS4]